MLSYVKRTLHEIEERAASVSYFFPLKLAAATLSLVYNDENGRRLCNEAKGNKSITMVFSQSFFNPTYIGKIASASLIGNNFTKAFLF